jgi:helix-turn-helix protein
MDAPMRRAEIHLDADTVAFPGNDQLAEHEGPFEIDLASVVFFEVLERTIGDDQRLVLSVGHVNDGQTVTSEVSIPSRRKMNILGRYLRQMYFYIKNAVKDVDVDEKSLEVLVGLYSSGPDIDLAPLLGVEQAELDRVLEQLYEDGLIDGTEEPCALTPQGRFVVNEEIEGVNV